MKNTYHFQKTVPIRSAIRVLAVFSTFYPWLFTVPLPALGDNLRTRLKAVERDLDENLTKNNKLKLNSIKTTEELRDIRQNTIRISRTLYSTVAEADFFEERLNSLQALEQTKAKHLENRKLQVSKTISALQRIVRNPPATLIAIPQSTNDTIRTVMLLRSVLPELQRRAKVLNSQITELTRLRKEINKQRKTLSNVLNKLVNKRIALASLTAKKVNLLQNNRKERAKISQTIKQLAKRAGSLRDLVKALVKQKTLEKTLVVSTGTIKKSLTNGKKTASLVTVSVMDTMLPAPGRITIGFGEKLSNGTLAKGIYIVTRSTAPVVAPFAGKVVFAGKFRSYGNLVIIDLGEKEHALISGMKRVSAEIGDDVLVGEPIGEMSSSSTAVPRLYFERRKSGEPIDPTSQNKNKVRG